MLQLITHAPPYRKLNGAMCEAGKGTAKIKVGLEMKLINIKRFDFGQELREN